MSSRIVYIKISQISILLPVIAGLISYKRLSPSFRILFYFFLATIGFEVQASIMGRMYGNNMPGLHLFTFIEFLVFSFVYYQFFRKYQLLSLLIAINVLIFSALTIADAFFIHNIWTVNTLSRSYSSAALLFYALVYFYFMFSSDDVRYSVKEPVFWINAGILIYFGANVLYFMFNKDLLIRSPSTETIGLYVHAALNTIANFLFAQSFRCFKQKATS